MQKPYKEGKTGLKIGLKKTSILFIVFFFSKEIFPQIPINGFCQFNNFSAEKNFKSILSLNFNNDSYSDLLLFSPDQKKIVSMAGEKNGNFIKTGVYKIPYQITAIKGLNEKDNKIKRYAFISRQNMRAGIYAFTNSGKAYLTNSIKFKSYPAGISLADINKNGSYEFLISGPSFDGLSVVSQSAGSLKEKKIAAGASFSEAVFTDLSNDGYPDIAAFNIINNSLVFFYNQSHSTFKQVRVIKMDQPIYSLHAVDMNLDGYPDLLYTEGNSINIMYGDYVSAYSNKTAINTRFHPDKIITGDFNRDGKIDIAYLNFNEGIISIIYGKNNGGFYPEIIYLKKEGLQDIIPYYSKFINGIASISPAGNIFTIRNLLSFSGSVNISIGAEPAAISSFDEGNNGINDLCYIDNYESKLKLIVRNAEGIPSTFYSYQLNDNYSNILVDNYYPAVKSFYCFTPGKRLIEILKLDFKQGKEEQNEVYSPGAIEDLKIRAAESSFDNIYIAFQKEHRLGLSIMEYKDYRYSEADYFNLADNVLSAGITNDKVPGLIYWQKTPDGASMNKISIANGTALYNKLYSFSEGGVTSVCSLTGEIFNNGKESTISFVQAENKNYIVVSNYKNSFVIGQQQFKEFKDTCAKKQLYLGEVRNNGLEKIFIYSPENSSVNRIDLLNRGRELNIQRIAEAENVEDFLIQKMSSRNFHLIFTDKLNNCITVRQL